MSAEVSGAGSVERAAAEPRYWLATTPEGSDVPLWGPDEAGDYCDDSDGRTGWWNRGSLTDLRPAMVVEEPDEAQIRAIVDRHMQEIATPLPAADADEVEAVFSKVWDWYGGYDVKARNLAEAVLAALAPIRAAQLAAAEERGRRAVMAELRGSLHHHYRHWGGRIYFPAWVPEHLRRLADATAPTTNDDYRTDAS